MLSGVWKMFVVRHSTYIVMLLSFLFFGMYDVNGTTTSLFWIFGMEGGGIGSCQGNEHTQHSWNMCAAGLIHQDTRCTAIWALLQLGLLDQRQQLCVTFGWCIVALFWSVKLTAFNSDLLSYILTLQDKNLSCLSPCRLSRECLTK